MTDAGLLMALQGGYAELFGDRLAVLAAIQIAWMTLFWLLHWPLRNAGLIDFAWPSSFTAMALYFGLTGDGFWLRRLLVTAPFVICGTRFMAGWTVRTWQHGEDRRWALWRKRWEQGEGWLGIRSYALNLFVFYQAQGLFNVLLVSVPLVLCTGNPTPELHWLEVAALGLWAAAFGLENLADVQLAAFKAGKQGPVCDTGLWRYSRHPNYFFELLLWVSYALVALPSASTLLDYLLLALLPLGAYWFLVCFTGIFITEQSSLQHRGEPYRRYQEQTSRFVPWFPKGP